MKKIGLDRWLEAAINSVGEVSTSLLEQEENEVLSKKEEMPEDIFGSFIPVLSSEKPIYFALILEPRTCQEIAEILYSTIEEDDDFLPNVDVADAINETVNNIAGCMIREIQKYDPDIRLGLPVFLDGKMVFIRGAEYKCAQMKLGKFKAHLLVTYIEEENGLELSE